jgi:alkylhydroperoxidase family enzyme
VRTSRKWSTSERGGTSQPIRNAGASVWLTQTQDLPDEPDEPDERATGVLTEQQYAAVIWAIAVINTWNRVILTSRLDLP